MVRLRAIHLLGRHRCRGRATHDAVRVDELEIDAVVRRVLRDRAGGLKESGPGRVLVLIDGRRDGLRRCLHALAVGRVGLADLCRQRHRAAEKRDLKLCALADGEKPSAAITIATPVLGKNAGRCAIPSATPPALMPSAFSFDLSSLISI